MGEIMRTTLGPKLAAIHEASLEPPSLILVELVARLRVAEAMAEFDRSRPEQTARRFAAVDQ